jgi:hypothetical protein
LQREILGRATPFAALIRNGRLEGLVERQELARRSQTRRWRSSCKTLELLYASTLTPLPADEDNAAELVPPILI